MPDMVSCHHVSIFFSLCELISTGLPYGVAVSYDAWPGFGASIKWKLDYAPPANENVAADLKCVVVIDGQQLGDPVPISSRSVPVDPAVISRSSCITVGVCHSSHKQLGELYSEPSKGIVVSYVYVIHTFSSKDCALRTSTCSL